MNIRLYLSSGEDGDLNSDKYLLNQQTHTMKKLSLLLVLALMIFGACKKEDEGFKNLLRIKNSLATLSIKCKVADVDFGTIAPGTITEYKAVPGGESELSGNLTGTITLPEIQDLTSDSKYTMTLNADSTVTLVQDEP